MGKRISKSRFPMRNKERVNRWRKVESLKHWVAFITYFPETSWLSVKEEDYSECKKSHLLLVIEWKSKFKRMVKGCLLYTSDAADEEDSVDLGGRRIIKKIFFFKQKTAYEISACLVGSEMCIRDRCKDRQGLWRTKSRDCKAWSQPKIRSYNSTSVSYTHLTLPTKRIV